MPAKRPSGGFVGYWRQLTDGAPNSNDFIGGHPANFAGFIGDGGAAGFGRAAEDESNHATGHVLVNAGEAVDADEDAGLLQDFAADAFLEGLVQFEHAAWRLPLAVVAAADDEKPCPRR